MNKEEDEKLQPILRTTLSSKESFTKNIIVDHGLNSFPIKKPNSYWENFLKDSVEHICEEGHFHRESSDNAIIGPTFKRNVLILPKNAIGTKDIPTFHPNPQARWSPSLALGLFKSGV